jgi:hypothetical protein
MGPAEPVLLQSVSAASLVVAIVAVVIAAGSLDYGRRLARASEKSATLAGDAARSSDRSASAAEDSVKEARRSADAAERAAESAAVTADLDIGRRHSELKPHLLIECEPAGQVVRMTVRFRGPGELRRLDELRIRIRDDHPGRGQGSPIAGGPTPEQVAAHVWGPYRFAPGAAPTGGDVPDETGRMCTARGLPVGESMVFLLEGTRPPSWSAWSLVDWQREMGALLRLELTCRAPGWQPWILAPELKLISGRGTVAV